VAVAVGAERDSTYIHIYEVVYNQKGLYFFIYFFCKVVFRSDCTTEILALSPFFLSGLEQCSEWARRGTRA